MDARKWQVLFMTFVEDLSRFTIDEIRDGCRRYRQSGESKWFPTPGQLMAACRDPFEVPPRRYPDAPNSPPVKDDRSPEGVTRLIEGTRAKYGAKPHDPVAAVKTEILARPPLVMTDELQERERALAGERADALASRLQAGGGGSW